LADLWADFMRALGAAERVFELLDRKPSMAPSGGMRLEKVSGAVALENVRFSYPTRKDVTVIDDVSLRLDPGEVVAVVGPSGAGKSTLASLIARLYDPYAGRILLDGRDVRELDVTFLRQQIGTVAQEPILFSNSVAENIRYGRPGASREDIVKDALVRLMSGRTTLIIAHRLSTVKDAGRVVVLDAGRIVQSGAHAALLREDGLYRRLVERQFVAA